MLTEVLPAVASVTVNVCPAVAPLENDRLDVLSVAPLAVMLTVAEPLSAPFGVTVNVVATPVVPLVDPVKMKAVAPEPASPIEPDKLKLPVTVTLILGVTRQTVMTFAR
jgi:hypothetical protein